MDYSADYFIEGKSFSREDLMAHCHMKIHDCKKPDWYRKVFQFVESFLDPGSGPILQQSSGTTGDPKTFELSREAMTASAEKTLSFFALKPGDRVLLGLSVDYIAGKMMVVRALEGGLDLVLTEPSSRPLQHVEGNFDLVPMVPLQVIESINAGDMLSRCGILLIGGGELSAVLKKQVKEFSDCKVYESFGMSETYTHFALRRINGPDAHFSFRVLEGAEISLDSRGCLVVNYEGISAGPVTTNDLVEIEQGGLAFTWLGRYDNVINTGGIKVIPEILEEKIGKLLDSTVLILPVEDEKLGQKMVLLVEGDGQVASWKATLAHNLASFEVPKGFIPVSEIPRNAAFKPDRLAARKLLS